MREIDTALVLSVLEPIWKKKPETASRLRGRIESVISYATEYRSGENPARWRRHLDQMLPRRSKIAPVEHHAALPYASIPEYMVVLRENQFISARALEFTILTAARTGETIHGDAGACEAGWADGASFPLHLPRLGGGPHEV